MRPSKKKKLFRGMSSPSTRLQAKSPNPAEVSPDQVNTMPMVHKPVSLNAHKAKSKSARKLSIQSPYTRLTLSTQGLKDSWRYSLVTLVISRRIFVIRLTRRLLSGEKRVKLRLFLVCCLLMRFICWIWSASPSSIEHLRANQHQSSSSQRTEVSQISAAPTTKAHTVCHWISSTVS